MLELGADDIKAIDATALAISETKGFTRYVYPDFGVDFGFPDKS